MTKAPDPRSQPANQLLCPNCNASGCAICFGRGWLWKDTM